MNGEALRVRGAGGIATMILTICREYRSLPDVRELGLPQIRFFYQGLWDELIDRGSKISAGGG